MWKGIVFPTIVMAVTWLLVSVSTTYYIFWLDESYQRVFAENVAAMQSAGRVQEATWELLSVVVSKKAGLPEKPARLQELLDLLAREVQTLRKLALTEREQILSDRLEGHLVNYKQSIENLSNNSLKTLLIGNADEVRAISALTDQMVETAQQFRTINQQLLNEAADRRENTTGSVLAARTSVQILGQVLGVAYGWWMARRLQRTVARITVSLRDATNSETQLGAVRIDQRQDLDAVQNQVELVVARMREANHELQRARHEVLRSERLAAVGELAAGVAHELRNPLTSVKLLLQYVAQKGTSNEPLTSNLLQLILDEIARMESTIQGMLDFSRPPQLNRSRHDLRDTLQRAINLVLGRAQHQKVRLVTELGDGPLFLHADAAQLNQVFVNLLINGLEAMPDGGDLVISAGYTDEGDAISVTIRDTGEGISAAIEKRLFEPFATTKERGTGLGLAVSRRIVEQHRGTILAENHPTGGAVFRVLIQAATDEADLPDGMPSLK